MMNVSPTTVANAIHGRTSKVSKENVERIQQALKDHNYVPKMGLEALTKAKPGRSLWRSTQQNATPRQP